MEDKNDPDVDKVASASDDRISVNDYSSSDEEKESRGLPKVPNNIMIQGYLIV